MVIGVLTTSYPRHADDHAGSFVGDRVRALLDAGHAVDVIAAGPDGATTRARADRLTITRIGGGAVGSLFDGEGAPERLERGGARAWLAALGFWNAQAAALRARAAALDAVEAHWLLPSAAVAIQAAPG
ncbi:MAG TPA: hypothetical protein VMU50_04650, partial [Polyangia bacterium]|nr:hypothetical protein [Polyangia bacterium]